MRFPTFAIEGSEAVSLDFEALEGFESAAASKVVPGESVASPSGASVKVASEGCINKPVAVS